MNNVSGNPEHYIVNCGYAVDYGHRVESRVCADESELGESMVLAGFQRAESERSAAASASCCDNEQTLPSEAYVG